LIAPPANSELSAGVGSTNQPLPAASWSIKIRPGSAIPSSTPGRLVTCTVNWDRAATFCGVAPAANQRMRASLMMDCNAPLLAVLLPGASVVPVRDAPGLDTLPAGASSVGPWGTPPGPGQLSFSLALASVVAVGSNCWLTMAKWIIVSTCCVVKSNVKAPE